MDYFCIFLYRHSTCTESTTLRSRSRGANGGGKAGKSLCNAGIRGDALANRITTSNGAGTDNKKTPPKRGYLSTPYKSLLSQSRMVALVRVLIADPIKGEQHS